MHAESRWRDDPFDADVFSETMRQAVDDDVMHYVAVAENSSGEVVGMMAASVQRYMFNRDVFINERLVFVTKASRGSKAIVYMKDLIEQWGREIQARRFNIGIMNMENTDKTAGLYEKMGFERVGVFFQKDL